jgi:hypothetical protein
MNQQHYDERYATDPNVEPMTAGQQSGSEPLSTADMAGMTPPRAAQSTGDATAEDVVRDESRATETARSSGPADGDQSGPLLDEGESREMRGRWDAVQTGFVDEPRRAVERADQLVAEAMKRLAESFASERSNLESQWSRGDQVSTEDLRMALRRYRTFFERLLSI